MDDAAAGDYDPVARLFDPFNVAEVVDWLAVNFHRERSPEAAQVRESR